MNDDTVKHDMPAPASIWRPWKRLACQDGSDVNIDMAEYRFGVKEDDVQPDHVVGPE